MEELKSKFEIEKLALIATPSDDDKLKVDLICKVVGEKYAFQTSYKVSKELLNPESDVLAQLMQAMDKLLREVLEGKKELNAVV